MAGGYQDSSGDEDGLTETRLAPYAPPRLVATSRLGQGAFLLPGSSEPITRTSVPPSRHISASSSNRPTPVAESMQSARNTPAVQTAPVSRGSTIEPSSATNLAPPNDPTKLGLKLSAAYKPNNARSNLALERQINELTALLEDFKHTSEERQKGTETTLTLILETIKRLEYLASTAASQTPGPRPSTPSGLCDSKPPLSNPTPSPELIDIVSKVVSEARSRVGKKKGGADDNSCKEHARNTFYRMLGITAAREVRPFFEDEYGDPDTLPSQFVNPDTGYCQPYPHWKTPLTKQVAWIPTYMLRFRSTIPNDRSELSETLRGLSDEAIVILLNDGPFKSATTAWRDAKKSDLEIETMRSNARRYQRCDRKAAVRAAHIKSIPSLQGPEWEYLSHPGYMSQDESNVEGAHHTKRPEHRAQWENNLYDAILVAEREKARSRPGLCPRFPHRNVEIIKSPVPHLERGTGSGKFTVRIALCGISKAWRQSRPDEFKKYSHLVNMKETAKPNITPFLEQHPMSMIDGDAHEDKPDETTVKLEGEHFGAWGVPDYDGDEESGAILEICGNVPEYGATGVTDGSNGDIVVIPIDPQLTDKSVQDSGQPGSTGNLVAPHLPYPPLTVVDAPPARLNDNTPAHPYGSEMPPPPPLVPDLNTSTSQAANDDVLPTVKEVKKGGASEVGCLTKTAGKTEGEGPPAVTTAPKRRGRPLGSKNKKTKTSA